MSESDDAQENILWDEEVENLKEGQGDDYFKPENGTNHIKFLDEGVIYEDEKEYDDEPQQYVKFKVEVDGEEKVWDIRKSGTPNSKFGQIARYAKKNDGLEGEEISWFKQGSGVDTNHVLMDLEDGEMEK